MCFPIEVWTSPRARSPFCGVYLVCDVLWFLNVLLLWSTRPDSKSQSLGDSLECSVLRHFPLRERGRVAESSSVVLGCSRRDSRVGEDLARWAHPSCLTRWVSRMASPGHALI